MIMKTLYLTFNVSFHFNYSIPYEIKAAINRLKNKCNIDDVSAEFLKICLDFVSNILCNLFNQCIEESTYPDRFKTSRVTPLYKKGVKSKIENHRPISVLCNISKIIL